VKAKSKSTRQTVNKLERKNLEKETRRRYKRQENDAQKEKLVER